MHARFDLPSALIVGALLVVACAGGAPTTPARPAAATAAPAAPAPPSSPPPLAGEATRNTANVATEGRGPAAPAAPTRPDLPTAPLVSLKAAIGGVSSYGTFHIARERGYFQEAGLDVELIVSGNVNEHLPALAQGQVQVGSCSNSVGCFNALQRGVDLKIVAGLSLAGQTEKSRGSGALVARTDLWDNGTLREARDFAGRTVYLVAGAGSGQHAPLARWLRQHGVDPHSVSVSQMLFPDMLAAMANRGIEAAMQSEPLLTAGLTRDLHRVVATIEEMHPTVQLLYVMYYGGIDRLGPRVGERFMTGFLRGVRDYVNAFEYGVEQDAIIDILTRETIIKDPAVYRQIKFAWVDPNGVFARTALQGDADLFAELGLMGPLDLSATFDDRYRQFAVDYLGEYRLPR